MDRIVRAVSCRAIKTRQMRLGISVTATSARLPVWIDDLRSTLKRTEKIKNCAGTSETMYAHSSPTVIRF